MNLRPVRICVLGSALVVCGVLSCMAAGIPAGSAVLVSAEITQGKLSPMASQPGDMVVLKLKTDLKSNGVILLRKGSTINGVIRTAKTNASERAKARLQSLVDVDWMPLISQGKKPRNLSIALQSVTQVIPSVTPATAATIDSFAAKPASRSVNRTSSPHNAALLKMPFVTEADQATNSAINAALKNSSGRLYRIGRGQITASGSQQMLEIFSHLNNDTVITSANANFEILPGAQVRLLVGVNRN